MSKKVRTLEVALVEARCVVVALAGEAAKDLKGRVRIARQRRKRAQDEANDA